MTDDEIRRGEDGDDALCWVPWCERKALRQPRKPGDVLRPAPCARHAGATKRPTDSPVAWRSIE